MEDELDGMATKEGGGASASDNFRKRALGEKIGADVGVRVSLV